MKKYVLIIQIILFNKAFSQSTENNNRGPCGEVVEHLYIINGNVFSPKTKEDNKAQIEIKFCESSNHIYYLEGLRLTEKKFLELGIKPKYFVKKKLMYTYQNNNAKNCVEFINLYVSVSINIEINGEKLKEDEEGKILKNISSDKLVAVNHKKPFFGKSTIEIFTLE